MQFGSIGRNEYINTDNMQEFIDIMEIQKLQKKFCDIAQVFAFCVSENGQMMTEMSGNPEEILRIKQYISKDEYAKVFELVAASALEEQLVEDTMYPNLKFGIVSVKVSGRPIINWIITAVIADVTQAGYAQEPLQGFTTVISEKNFYQALDLIRMVSQKIIGSRVQLSTAQAESRRSMYSRQEMVESLRRVETMTEILQYLEKDEAIEIVAVDVLKLASEYLQIGNAILVKLHRDGNNMDVLAEWCNTGVASLFDQTRNIPRFPMLKYDKPLVISSDAKITAEEKEILQKIEVKAMVAIPIFINHVVGMYLCYNECKKEKYWTVDDIRFMNDVARIVQSIIVKRLQKNSLARSYEAVQSVLDNVGSAVFVRDTETNQILFTNKILRSAYEKEVREGLLEDIYQDVMVGREGESSFEVERNYRDHWYEIHCTNLKWVDGHAVILCVIYDITEKKIYQNRIEQQAYTDFLTGLFNRMCCERDLAIYIDEAKMTRSHGSLLYLDLDNFKHVNDGLGHQYGDVLLKAIAHSLQRIEGITNACYRMGGDEFVIIITPKYYDKVEDIVRAIQIVFSKPWYLKNADYYCTMSMGIVDFPDEGESVPDLIKKADMAMYEAKKSGKNRVAHYSDNIGSYANKRLSMEKNMRAATLNGFKEFEVYYQPIIDIRKEGAPCTGAEALIRWNSAEFGFMSPAEFIPLAEYLGLINPIGNFVLVEACKACKHWNDHGHPNFKVNVNLSIVQLLQNNIVDIVAEAVSESGIRPDNLTLEVTESLAINDFDMMKSILNSIRMLGVRIALDDFGTGYSSLSHIRELPLDVIKIDQSFVRNMGNDTYSESLISMVSELATIIDVKVCVEGIEHKEQYEMLTGMKIRLMQGYYFDRPMKRDDFEKKYVFGATVVDVDQDPELSLQGIVYPSLNLPSKVAPEGLNMDDIVVVAEDDDI